jgi:agmatine deiminase
MTAPAPPWRMPAEWARHRATWIGWPHHEPDWPGKLSAVQWAYTEIARVLAAHEAVEILCQSEEERSGVRDRLVAHAVNQDRVRLHVVPTDRVWLRDSAPTAVHDREGHVVWLNWRFNGWAKYDNWSRDRQVGAAIAQTTGLPRLEPRRPDTGEPLVLEGGGIETNGDGLLLVTEEWLTSDVQVRNPGLTRQDYERLFADWLGTPRTIWLGEGCVGDDTHGHVDDVARFVARDTVVLAVEPDPADENHRRSLDNLRRLEHAAKDPAVGSLRIVTLPFPAAQYMYDERLPASYANFYIANGAVLVPTFNDVRDREALQTLASLFPDRHVIGIHAVDLVWGQGTLHCLTQQEPAAKLTRDDLD